MPDSNACAVGVHSYTFPLRVKLTLAEFKSCPGTMIALTVAFVPETAAAGVNAPTVDPIVTTPFTKFIEPSIFKPSTFVVNPSKEITPSPAETDKTN
ncbi:hypothetical protein SDC9_142139 [bioreactor metagenome]|uniref:Uncharacterized protein n=1 Tax=bioreactor metagenome TaxID=1076179 RepID=A0A645DZN4_9ZZZZ